MITTIWMINVNFLSFLFKNIQRNNNVGIQIVDPTKKMKIAETNDDESNCLYVDKNPKPIIAWINVGIINPSDPGR